MGLLESSFTATIKAVVPAAPPDALVDHSKYPRLRRTDEA
jgi:hypothetical protein